MVFGWRRTKSKDSTESTQLVKQISLEKIEQILQEKNDELNNHLVEKSKPIRNKIDTNRKEIINIISHFESDDLGSQDVDKNIKVIIERAKNSVISGIRKETSKQFGELKRYQDVVNLNSEVAQLLKRTGDILGPNSRAMHVFARKYADKLKEILADIAKTKAELQKLVDEHNDLDSRISKIQDWITKITDSKKDIELKKNTVLKTKEEIQSNVKTIQRLEEEIRNLKSSNKYIDFLRFRKELESLETENEKIKHVIDLQFSKISRPLGKYSYVSSLEKSIKLVMETMIQNPYEAITEETKNAVIEVLQSVIKSTVAGNISVKDSDKSVENIEETILRLDEFLKLKNDLIAKKKFLEKNLLFNNKDLEEREADLVRCKERKIECESEIVNLENKIQDSVRTMPQIVKNTESQLGEVLGTKFTIT